MRLGCGDDAYIERAAKGTVPDRTCAFLIVCRVADITGQKSPTSCWTLIDEKSRLLLRDADDWNPFADWAAGCLGHSLHT